jgi:small subunit ribosomal protein S20
MIDATNNSNTNIIVDNSLQDKKNELKNVLNNIYSIIDKAVKKNVMHKNTAARKKARVGKLFVKII